MEARLCSGIGRLLDWIRGWKEGREVVYGVKELVFPEWDYGYLS